MSVHRIELLGRHRVVRSVGSQLKEDKLGVLSNNLMYNLHLPGSKDWFQTDLAHNQVDLIGL